MTQPHRLSFLDALRGLAAVYVVLFHVMAMPSPPLATDPISGAVLGAGGTGVALFFVISAFSLCYTMPRHARSGTPLLSFYLHRVFRIAPLFLVMLVFSIWRAGRGDRIGPSLGEVAASLTFTFNLFTGWEEGIVAASWAIGVEMLFYAVFPLLYVLITTLARAWVAAIMSTAAMWLACAGVFGGPGLAAVDSFGLLRHLPVFTYGILAYHLFTGLAATEPHRAARIGGGVLLGAAALWVALVAAYATGHVRPAVAWGLFGLCYAALLVGMSRVHLGLVVNRATGYLGQISYSLYLMHPIVVSVLVPLFRRIQAAVPQPTLAYLACAALTLAVALPLAHLGYRWVEVPGIRAGHRVLAAISARLSGQRIPGSDATG
jgi:peptidoglycan/LPS O-acetylase OafA/YrhL